MVTTLLLLTVGFGSAAPFATAQDARAITIKQRSGQGIRLPAGGMLLGNVYTNSEYKLELRIPQGFALGTSTVEDTKRGMELIAGGNEQRKRALEAAAAETANLLEVKLQKPGIFRSFSLMTEDISSAPLVETGKDYTNHLVTQLRASQLKFKASDGDDESFDGRIFSTKQLEMQVKGTTVYQAYRATVVGQTALVMLLTSESSKGINELMATFKPHFVEPLSVTQKANYRPHEEQYGTASVNNGVYTNSVLKMRFRVPAGWIMRDGARQAILQKALEGEKGKAKLSKADKADMEILFVATPPESANSIMMISFALNGTRVTPAAATESMVVAAQKRGFQPLSKAEEKKISGQPFSRSVLKGFASGLDVYQAYNTAVLHDHILCLVVTARDAEQLDDLLAVSAKSLDFE
jgi:hypothetical protein